MSNWTDHVSAYLVAPMIAWIVTQIIKMITKGLKGTWDWRNLYRSGSMPSSHAAVVVSLVVVLMFEQGVASAEFGIGAVFAAIVMYDAVNVRQAVGEHGIILRQLLEQHNKPQRGKAKHIRESLGHRPVEVLVGSIIGAAIALLVLVV